MLEHINTIEWDDLVKVFCEVSGTTYVGIDRFKYGIRTHLQIRYYTIASSSSTENLVTYKIHVKLDDEYKFIEVTRGAHEHDYALDLRLCLFYFYPDGWIDLPD